MKLIDAVAVESIEINLRSRNKADLFQEMVELLKRNSVLESVNESTVLKALNERLGAWGVGRHIYTGDVTIGLKGRIAFECPGIDGLLAAHQVVLVEGVGGWEVPLAPGLRVADLAADLGLPVVGGEKAVMRILEQAR